MVPIDSLPNHSRHRHYIYGLRDPDSKELRYIGATHNPKCRAACHNSAARMGLEVPVSKWIADLEAQGKAPVMEILCELDGRLSSRLSDAAERAAIRWLSFCYPLLNVQHNLAALRASRARWRQRNIQFDGKTMSIAGWARTLGLTRERLRQRLEKYSIEVALTTPKGQKPDNRRSLVLT